MEPSAVFWSQAIIMTVDCLISTSNTVCKYTGYYLQLTDVSLPVLTAEGFLSSIDWRSRHDLNGISCDPLFARLSCLSVILPGEDPNGNKM